MTGRFTAKPETRLLTVPPPSMQRDPEKFPKAAAKSAAEPGLDLPCVTIQHRLLVPLRIPRN